ncbi:response regulator transcription factor [Candidatus Lucifugimonas marina]|uniref:Response regulator n=1 Tax=Candidatus Lucifugimonas marina TaxID=3038979 RepID=A0AAJ5ZEL0_9CHLR|nr:response regulator [SAR202 cluster bacterium JH702]MDG0870903.1 response regulator [SAR202 cluster bacterium JH639]WFG35863.1 response regulator [SAR202 cluster bacterium JH545]WFG39808.1 response regulator [SAR202 cluster bacterium JH1073]
MKVLIIEDDADAAGVASTCLKVRWSDADIDLAETNYESRLLLEKNEYDIVLVDLNLPDGQSTELLNPAGMIGNPAVLVITASDDEISLFKSLEAGADDYISKPYSPIELQARVNAAIRKRGQFTTERTAQVDADVLDFGAGIKLDRQMKSLRINNKQISLTPMEYNLLDKLANHIGRVVSMDELGLEVWDSTVPEIGAIKAVIKRLRVKLERNSGSSHLIRTHRGFGYSINVQDDLTSAA